MNLKPATAALLLALTATAFVPAASAAAPPALETVGVDKCVVLVDAKDFGVVACRDTDDCLLSLYLTDKRGTTHHCVDPTLAAAASEDPCVTVGEGTTCVHPDNRNCLVSQHVASPEGGVGSLCVVDADPKHRSAAAAPSVTGCHTLVMGPDVYRALCIWPTASCKVYYKAYNKDNDMSMCLVGTTVAGAGAPDPTKPLCVATPTTGVGAGECFSLIGGCYLYVWYTTPKGTTGTCLWSFDGQASAAGTAWQPGKTCVLTAVGPDIMEYHCVNPQGPCYVNREGYHPNGDAYKCYVSRPDTDVVPAIGEPRKVCQLVWTGPDIMISYCVDPKGPCYVSQEGYGPGGNAYQCYVERPGVSLEFRKQCTPPIVGPDIWIEYCVAPSGECIVGREGYHPECYVERPGAATASTYDPRPIL
ncbi:MAG TPA: hypothetical protein VNZ52_14545 [Candidatus Thermoplasmatota archaeon]|nr:hypothetical protein [Candidatus Thermoplasmatota archaeon]